MRAKRAGPAAFAVAADDGHLEIEPPAPARISAPADREVLRAIRRRERTAPGGALGRTEEERRRAMTHTPQSIPTPGRAA